MHAQLSSQSNAMSECDTANILTENDCLTFSQQYDPELIFHVSVPRKGYQRIGPNAFLRCGVLRVLDVSGNKLSTLSGLEIIAPQLTFLNAAENSLHDISALVKCASLQRCFLEGNMLASVDSLQPLVALPCLVELVLQRHVPFANIDQRNGIHHRVSDEMLLLDNPVCRDVAAYKEQFLAKVPHVRWVDGVFASSRTKALAGCPATELDGTIETTTTAIVDAAVSSFQSIRQQMTGNLNEETALRRQLECAADRCNPKAMTTGSPPPQGQ
ncbi:hypothetical protein JKF63_00856 [Porcisia hertigi]|uniref:Uncharacterized protein n=1 Tax=Porcisia hertigi TaxID=2761500 RepID=A0A836HFV5_9TRYP|nr:hypothetical protein JKF63_00856 [Porcisia hertigi]